MPPVAPPNEGSTQFVYQMDNAFFLVDYSANTVSLWDENSQQFVNRLGSLQEFLSELIQELKSYYTQQLLAANPMPVPQDYFGNSDSTLGNLALSD